MEGYSIVNERDEYRRMDARELGIYFRETGGDPRFLTEDGQEIRHGEVYWNNELRATRVDFYRSGFGRYWDGWFATLVLTGDGEVKVGPTMNGERLAYKFEGKRPEWNESVSSR